MNLNIWFWIHISLFLSGVLGLVTALGTAVLYLWQSAQLKSKHPGKVFFRLPALDTLDRLHFRALGAGVILFSLGILSGLFWASDLKAWRDILRDPKVILSFFTCFLYWVLLCLRLSALRRGQKIAFGTLLAFALLFITFISSYFAPSSFHRGL